MQTTTSLAYRDLRGYIDAADKLGELRRVEGADWDLELGAITEVAARASNPKVVLFDKIKGYPKGFRVITNPVCSAVTTALAFGLDPQLTGLDIIRAWKERLGKQTPIKPLEVPSGPTGSKGPFGEWTGSPAEGCAVYLRRPARMVEHGAG
jgi:3-polyprenyl-4-hydroxybenzoate decarboxylase